MRRTSFVVAVLLALSTLSLAGSPSYVVPTTTLAAQTSNNTSAVSTFASQTNGNRGAANISKVDVHTLLYSGSTTKVYAHLMLWFGGSNHMNVGYNSDDATQVNNQINDMISRGIDGVIIDWYGSGTSIDQATQLVMAAAETHPGFTFAVMIDKGTIEWDSCSGCTPQQALVAQLQYLEQTYFSSPAYMKLQGQPVVTNFDIDLFYSIDWTALQSSLSTQPVFLFQNNDGFTHTLSGGSYSWVMPTDSNFGLSYLSSFYQSGMAYPNEQTVGAAYKGFNDTLASWSANRIMSQQCGQTWLQTFSQINSLYSAGKPLSNLQLVTWNDYEEGTELESGIDNCLTLSASMKGSSLNWAVTGNENTVDHYNVYISTDGQNLMQLTDLAEGIHSLNLCGFPVPAGNYKMFVQAVGKPSLANQMTGAVSYTPACASTTAGPSTVTFSATPNSITIPAGQTGIFTISAKPQSGSFNSAITLSCSGIPSTLECSFSPETITPGSGTATSTVTISAASTTAANLPAQKPTTNAPLYAGLLLPFGLVGLTLMGKSHRGRAVQFLALFAVIGLGMSSMSCGGVTTAGQRSTVPASSSYSFTVQGNSSASQLSANVTVIVE
jgi:hypothetical protein